MATGLGLNGFAPLHVARRGQNRASGCMSQILRHQTDVLRQIGHYRTHHRIDLTVVSVFKDRNIVEKSKRGSPTNPRQTRPRSLDDMRDMFQQNEIQRKTLTTYVPIVLLLLLAMVIDAAYSGDWSRIGVLTLQQEEFLRGFVLLGAVIHVGIGVTAAGISKNRGEKRWLVRGMKAFIVGAVGLFEVIVLPLED